MSESAFSSRRFSYNADGSLYQGNQQYSDRGIVKWCALCGVHKDQVGGTIQYVMGGRHFVCKLHPKPDSAKKKNSVKKSAV